MFALCLFLLTFRIKKHVESKLKQTTHMSVSRKVFSVLSLKWPLTELQFIDDLHTDAPPFRAELVEFPDES